MSTQVPPSVFPLTRRLPPKPLGPTLPSRKAESGNAKEVCRVVEGGLDKIKGPRRYFLLVFDPPNFLVRKSDTDKTSDLHVLVPRSSRCEGAPDASWEGRRNRRSPSTGRDRALTYRG